MTDPSTILDSIRYALENSGRLPRRTSYATFEVDAEGGQSNVRLPLVEITAPDVVRNNPNHTDFKWHATDSNGNQIGYVYHARFEMDVEIDVWTVEGDGFDPQELGESVRRTLYQYDSKQLGNWLPTPDGSGELRDVRHFSLSDGGVRPDLAMTPALRRWRQTGEVWFREVVDTSEEYGSEDYITTVNGPADGDMTAGSEVEIIFDATPSTESTADNY